MTDGGDKAAVHLIVQPGKLHRARMANRAIVQTESNKCFSLVEERHDTDVRIAMGGFGAESDLLINHYLIEVKAAVNPALAPAWTYQVFGYALMDFSDAPKVQGIGFYLAR